MEDKTIECVECKSEFVFTVNEQKFYAEQGFNNEPKRCAKCRAEKKKRMNNRDNRDSNNNY